MITIFHRGLNFFKIVLLLLFKRFPCDCCKSSLRVKRSFSFSIRNHPSFIPYQSLGYSTLNFHSRPLAFASGGGFGFSSNQNRNPKKNGKGRNDPTTLVDKNDESSISTNSNNGSSQSSVHPQKRRQKGRLRIDPELFSTSISNPRGQTLNATSSTTSTTLPQLDRFGLPILTAENFFPPLPPDTELIGFDSGSLTSGPSLLEHIRTSLQNYLPICLDLFDESGVEKVSAHRISTQKPWKLQLLHYSPPVLLIENFLSEEECKECISLTVPPTPQSFTSSSSSTDDNTPVRVQSATFSSTLSVSKRTSTSWFCHFSSLPTFITKAKRLFHFSDSIESMEEPQLVRYRTGEEFSWHYDEVPRQQLDNGGQRIATLLVYLNTIDEHRGGGTVFRDLKGGTTVPNRQQQDPQQEPLTVRPTMGTALLFFPANVNGVPDDRTLHKGEVALDEKMIVQMWLHQRKYKPILPEGNNHKDAESYIKRIEEELGYC